MSSNNYYTYEEIMNQADTLELVYKDVLNGVVDLSFLGNSYDEIILFGCGTDYNLCQSASFFTKSLLNNRGCIALPTSELLINTEAYIKKNRKYLIIGFSRSGETTESINVVEKLKSRDNVEIFIFSAIKNSTIINLTDKYFICRGAAEKSVAMTKAYTGFLFAYCLMLVKFLDNKEMLGEFKYLIKYLKENISKLFEDIQNYLDKNDFNSYFVLGSGFNYGVAVEADLKMKEMSQTPSYSYHFHEFNHGPKTLTGKGDLCLILTLSKNMVSIEKIIKEIISLGPKILIVGSKDISKIKNENVNYLLNNSSFKFDFIKSFINIPVFQILAYSKAIKEKLNPDEPKNLNFTTKI